FSSRRRHTRLQGDWSSDVCSSDLYPDCFRALEQTIRVASGSAPILHFPMELGVVQERVEVTADLAAINPESATTQSAINRQEIEYTPGASRTNSLAMITDHVPGAYIVHDQLHIRGGHQVSWLVDG